MKVVVLGGVAAGTKVAAKLKRENRDNEVVIYTKEKEISYAGCESTTVLEKPSMTCSVTVFSCPARSLNLVMIDMLASTPIAPSLISRAYACIRRGLYASEWFCAI